MRMIEMKVFRIAFDDTGKNNTVILKEKRGKRFLPIFVGQAEAKAIENTIKGEVMPRPMTHDLIVNLCEQLKVKVISVSITNVVDSIFYADIKLRRFDDEEVIQLDARPSDALAIAVRSNCTLYCSDMILDEASILLT